MSDMPNRERVFLAMFLGLAKPKSINLIRNY
jgi:hypothetical protein